MGTKIVIIDGIRYKEAEAKRLGLLGARTKPVQDKARRAPTPVTADSTGGAASDTATRSTRKSPSRKAASAG